MSQEFCIAIIGAGLSGLSLAICLKNHNIPCILYESRNAPLDTGGGMMLTPNGLKSLQSVGIYDALLKKSFPFDKVYLQSSSTGAIIETVEAGNPAKYGLSAMRAHRFTVLQLLLSRVRELGVPICFNRKFSHIVSETDAGVSWQFVDGSTGSASLLVGADGIHSTVRSYIAPTVTPCFTGNINVTAVIPTSSLKLPASELVDLRSTSNKHPLPIGIVAPGLGAFVIAPGSQHEVLIATMRRVPEEPEGGNWKPIDADKAKLRGWLQEGVDQYPEIVRNAVADISDDELHVWPNYNIPFLEHWSSAATQGGKGRVVILGDAAHAVPPSGGQGVNQAFEDVHLLALTLAGLAADVLSNEKLQAALLGWQRFRQSRLEWVNKWNKYMEIRRLPAAAQADQGFDQEDLARASVETADIIFGIDYDSAARECLKEYRRLADINAA